MTAANTAASDDDPYGHFASGDCPSRYRLAGLARYARVVPCGRSGPHDGEGAFGAHRTAGAHYHWSNADAEPEESDG